MNDNYERLMEDIPNKIVSVLVYSSTNNWSLVDKLEFVELLRLKGTSEILALAVWVKSCQSARRNQPCWLVKLAPFGSSEEFHRLCPPNI
ncbi:MAG: hypothetical protein II295_04850 [Akkermansia sp.]|nr:hypothetical protein [Akkermansia sp.]